MRYLSVVVLLENGLHRLTESGAIGKGGPV